MKHQDKKTEKEPKEKKKRERERERVKNKIILKKLIKTIKK